MLWLTHLMPSHVDRKSHYGFSVHLNSGSGSCFIHSSLIEAKYIACPTLTVTAQDNLTKPLDSKQFTFLRDGILGYLV